ncbi:hypothetical protein [Pseudomonas sp.]|uniref:hypothetical protein n=1 Tax=Pseudomonas sp. TaxID=306 RepID=UPI0025858DC1|nr:hypothetical protein [Pseudomonas sp.]
MSRLLAVLLCALSGYASAELVYVESSAPAGALLDAGAVPLVLYAERPCSLSIPNAGQMRHAEVAYGGGRCWASLLGDSVTTKDASGNQTTRPKAAFVPARVVPGWRFEVLTPDPLEAPRL